MTPPYTVVIANRNEPDLNATVADIRGKFPAAEIVVVNDTAGAGPQLCRHTGIMAAKTDVVIIVDGHMRFAPGSLDTVAAGALAPGVVTCALCHHNLDQSFLDSPYAGARWAWKSEDRGQYFTLTGKWRDRADLGVIGCVMGACYGFRRDWYSNIGAPWRLGRGWGMDEETLSLLTWLMGGRCELVRAEVAHLYRIQSQVPYLLTPRQAAGVWANRAAFLEMLPLPDSDRAELSEWLGKNDIMRGPAGVEVRNLIDIPAARDIRRRLESAPRTFAQWKAEHITETQQKGEVQMRGELLDRARRAGIAGADKLTDGQIRQALTAPTAAGVAAALAGGGVKMETPPPGFLAAGAVPVPGARRPGRPRKTPPPAAPAPASTPAADPAPAPKPERMPNRITADLGAPCVHCGHRYEHRVTNTYPNGNRRRICGKCGLPFVTRELREGETPV